MTIGVMSKVLACLEDEALVYKKGTAADKFMFVLGVASTLEAISRFDKNEESYIFKAAALALSEELDELLKKMEAEAHGRC